MTSPLVSCIVPVYNGERFVRQALDSIWAQTYRPLEVIVIDGGSTDGTAEIIGGYDPRPRLEVIPGSGPPAKRSRGVELAHGEFVAFLDADDLWRPEKLARQMARFAALPELGCCLTHVQMFWEAELQHEAELFEGHPRAGDIPGYATTTLLARRSVFEQQGFFDPERWGTDAVEWLDRVGASGVVIEVLPEVLVERRMHSANMTRRLSSQFRQEWLQLVKDRLDRQRGRGQAPATESK